MIYGHDKTIHQFGYVDVEVDECGVVVAVWFRCQALPFKQTDVGAARAKTMNDMYMAHTQPAIKAIEV